MNQKKEGLTMPAESPQESSQREQDAMGIKCPTCLTAVLGLALNDQAEKSVIRNLVRLDQGPSAAKSFLDVGIRNPDVGCGAAIGRLVLDEVISVRDDGTIEVLPPDRWLPSRRRHLSVEQLASLPGKRLAPCRPSLDHQVVPRGQAESHVPEALPVQVEAPQPSTRDDDYRAVILKFDPSLPRKSKRLPTQETLRAICTRRPAKTS